MPVGEVSSFQRTVWLSSYVVLSYIERLWYAISVHVHVPESECVVSGHSRCISDKKCTIRHVLHDLCNLLPARWGGGEGDGREEGERVRGDRIIGWCDSDSGNIWNTILITPPNMCIYM